MLGILTQPAFQVYLNSRRSRESPDSWMSGTLASRVQNVKGVAYARAAMQELRTSMQPFDSLGDFIREARERKGMTQEELALRVGLSRPSITQLERGLVKNPRIAILQAIATILDVPPAAIFEVAGVSLTDAAFPGQLHWLATQLDEDNLRRLIVIGHALLQEQHGPP